MKKQFILVHFMAFLLAISFSIKADETRCHPDKTRYTGKLISANFVDIKLNKFLQVLGEFAEKDIFVADDIVTSITIKVSNQPWDKVLADIMERHDLTMYKITNDVINISNKKESQYATELLNLTANNANLNDVFGVIADLGRTRVEFSTSIPDTLRISKRFYNEPWEKVLYDIASENNLSVLNENRGLILITQCKDIENIDTEKVYRIRNSRSLSNLSPVRRMGKPHFTLQYINAKTAKEKLDNSKIAAEITRRVSKKDERGNVQATMTHRFFSSIKIFEKSNSLRIYTNYPRKKYEFYEYIKKIDQPKVSDTWGFTTKKAIYLCPENSSSLPKKYYETHYISAKAVIEALKIKKILAKKSFVQACSKHLTHDLTQSIVIGYSKPEQAHEVYEFINKLDVPKKEILEAWRKNPFCFSERCEDPTK